MERVLYAPRALPPLAPDVSQDPGPYAAWSAARETERARATRSSRKAVLCLVMPVSDAAAAAVRRTLEALRLQRGGWSLTVVTPEERLPEIREVVRASTSFLAAIGACGFWVAARSGSDRDLLGIGIRSGPGRPKALIFPGDVWAPDASALLSAALTPTNVVYADEDALGADGTPTAPRLKPDFSPEFLLTSAYVGRPLAMGAVVADNLPRLVATGTGTAALEHECALAATEAADAVVHIPEVLCHRTEKTPAARGATIRQPPAGGTPPARGCGRGRSRPRRRRLPHCAARPGPTSP